MNKKKVDSILKAAAVAGVAMGVGALADVNVVYAAENTNDDFDNTDDVDNTNNGGNTNDIDNTNNGADVNNGGNSNEGNANNNNDGNANNDANANNDGNANNDVNANNSGNSNEGNANNNNDGNANNDANVNNGGNANNDANANDGGNTNNNANANDGGNANNDANANNGGNNNDLNPKNMDTSDQEKDEAQKILDDIENTAGNYGVVAKDVTLNGDFESNFAADTVHKEVDDAGSNKNYTDNDDKGQSEDFYIGSVSNWTDGSLLRLKDPANVKSNVIIGYVEGEESVEIITNPSDSQQKLVIVTNLKDGSTKTIKIQNNGYGEVRAEGKKKTDTTGKIEDELNTIAGYADELKKQANEHNTVEMGSFDENGNPNNEYGKIDATKVDSDTVFVNVSGDKLFDTAKCNQDAAHHLIVLRENQTVVFNINSDAEEVPSFLLNGYKVCVKKDGEDDIWMVSQGQNENNLKYADHIVFNFGDYAGVITDNKGFTGNVIAPKATYVGGPTSTGQVIANKFSNPNGELHYNGDCPMCKSGNPHCND